MESVAWFGALKVPLELEVCDLNCTTSYEKISGSMALAGSDRSEEQRLNSSHESVSRMPSSA